MAPQQMARTEITRDIEDARAHGVEIDMRTATLMAFSPDCVKLLETDGRLRYMSHNGRCAMEIPDLGPVLGQEWWALWPERARALLKDAIELAAQGRQVNFVAECPTAAGTPACWDVTLTGIAAAGGGSVSEIVAVSASTDKPPSELVVY
ncbi:hypothetical protein SAMN05444413_1157 [Roseivivax marinus]|uniref:PAS domain-containing protein n=1 Tax=Roseivivax marinus TaxID=1379903 RepID=UPI0008D4DCEC|nr:PAS domain-containing protein [Roseivivax marinus]SEL74000.1 hypothetical protein SAMN05444413_1157 [Roseivivax marinus]